MGCSCFSCLHLLRELFWWRADGVLLVVQLDGLACDVRRNVRSTSAWRSFLADVSNQALNPMCQVSRRTDPYDDQQISARTLRKHERLYQGTKRRSTEETAEYQRARDSSSRSDEGDCKRDAVPHKSPCPLSSENSPRPSRTGLTRSLSTDMQYCMDADK